MRVYELPDGSVLPSVTTLLETVPKPQLADWAARLERDLIVEAAADLHEDLPHATHAPKLSRLAYTTTLRGRLPKKRAHDAAREAAGDIGQEVHKLIEWNLRRELGQPVGAQPRLRTEAVFAFTQYERWRAEVHLRPLLIEQQVWSKTYGYAGTLDLLVELMLPEHGCIRAVLDWKTGARLYPAYKLQNTAYAHALQEMGLAGGAGQQLAGVLVRFPKFPTDAGFETKVLEPEGHASRFAAFLHVLEVWRWLNGEDPSEAEREVIRALPTPVTPARAAARASAGTFSFAG